ncbi:hypothetical protein [Paenibacillus xylanexedens]|uniref:hypothetical protein n=1 Tax=Paenibacillus xylanexedens TaxID=528191 RepID=UPI0011A38DE4|nr:hypothetical protein [Paenibacillus xylanexedens]
MRKMYPAIVNSPKTELATAITQTQTDISVTDPSVLLPGEGIAVIGNGETAETITYTSVEGNTLKGCLRGYQGIARAWTSGTRVARNFAAADWDAARENILELADRLDTPERATITLQPGIHVVQADQNSAFRLGNIKGRTLVNLLGRDGNFETDSNNDGAGDGWVSVLNGATASIETVNAKYGGKAQRITTKASDPSPFRRVERNVNVQAGKKYVLLADVLTDGVGTCKINAQYTSGTTIEGAQSKENKVHFIKFSPTTDTAVTVRLYNYTPIGAVAWVQFDGASLYEVSDALYARIDVDITAANIREYLPYVDSVQPVRNPYAIRYGENLLPPFYEWTDQTGSAAYSTINAPYDVTIISPDSVARFYSYVLNVIPGETYSFNAESAANKIQWDYYKTWDSATSTGEMIGSRVKFTGSEMTFVVPSGANIIRIYLFNDEVVGTFNIKKWMLTLGNVAKPFKPREDAMLALQTELHANPVTETNADEVFEKDGQYFKLKKWRKAVLDGSLTYRWLSFASSTYKIVGCNLLNPTVTYSSFFATKYNGSLLTKSGNMTGPDNAYFRTSELSDFNLSIANTDSGWGDAYTPTADEIKAYFMGWKMSVDGTPRATAYNGTGAKVWIRITRMSDSIPLTGYIDYTTTLPTTNAGTDTLGNTYTPYQLVYQLATPFVESITSEGQLTLIEGDNQVEVGTGIVLRESTKAVMTKVGSIEYYHFNNIDPGVNNPFKYRVEKILNMYANGKRANGVVIKTEPEAYGKQDAHIEGKDFIKDGLYTTTYMMLDKSPITPFVGSVAENEKALLTDLVQDVQQATARLSVVESKKAEKDAPAWIAPTLLNGWTNYSTNDYPAVGFRKDAYGNVSIRGLISGGAIAVDVPLFILPVGYRPSKHIMFTVTCSDGNTPAITLLNIVPNGTVSLHRVSQNSFVTLFLPPFQAEQ